MSADDGTDNLVRTIAFTCNFRVGHRIAARKGSQLSTETSGRVGDLAIEDTVLGFLRCSNEGRAFIKKASVFILLVEALGNHVLEQFLVPAIGKITVTTVAGGISGREDEATVLCCHAQGLLFTLCEVEELVEEGDHMVWMGGWAVAIVFAVPAHRIRDMGIVSRLDIFAIPALRHVDLDTPAARAATAGIKDLMNLIIPLASEANKAHSLMLVVIGIKCSTISITRGHRKAFWEGLDAIIAWSVEIVRQGSSMRNQSVATRLPFKVQTRSPVIRVVSFDTSSGTGAAVG